MINEEFDGTNIKVIGVGGAGGNAVEHMVQSGIQGVQFIVANTDAQALERSTADVRLQLGKTGLGAGAQPTRGMEAAKGQRTDIRQALEGAHMVFITAGMGGGTGTGAAPVVAEVAKEMGILTVGVVTKPFDFEGAKRMRAAEEGIEELSRHVDSLIVILNDRLMDVMGEDAGVDECFMAANDVLRNAVGGIAEVITFPGLVNVDFEDVRTVMAEMGRAMMGSAFATGPERAKLAAEQAVSSPLLEGINLQGARGVLVNITAARQGLKLKEVHQVMSVVREFAAADSHIIFGAVYDDSMGDALRVTVVATGLSTGTSSSAPSAPVPAAQPAGPALNQSTHAVFRRRGPDGTFEPAVRSPAPVVAPARTTENHGFEAYDIPAFLRRQA